MRQHDRAARVRAIYEAAEDARLPPPSAREVGRLLGIGKPYVHALVRRLRDDRVSVRTNRLPRAGALKHTPLSENLSTDDLIEAAEMERANTRALERIKREEGWPPS